MQKSALQRSANAAGEPEEEGGSQSTRLTESSSPGNADGENRIERDLTPCSRLKIDTGRKGGRRGESNLGGGGGGGGEREGKKRKYVRRRTYIERTTWTNRK
uniref:Uncharacterized protein n=1 Tax=Chromera velia CCMP2878 TaxID=1169474 RepID=A0A0G4HM22_9ALVE|eukprot:Cvel_7430.t1-p1 / transcript=Cvel_7430.t1 / gene=Cvel_7430 / organism=Chromera_velia_CCMP2878 / gene_product=hypothetical protein / transcript_product=hypothetical protein / location=Cvel_scaffold388:58378-59214(-) / protein_length=101 / sequence_SO=supercontig / SO=protein_coding / is_pseudo=false